jgi:amino acid adenylation domain-containing protein
VIAPELTIRLAIKDLETSPEETRTKEIERLTLQDSREPFDLSRGPLLRALLLRLRADEHVLVVTIHHIVADGWSLGVLVRELSAFYEAFTEGTSLDLAELPVQYADFALWQRELLRGDLLEAQLDYWREKLGGELPILELPTDRPRPPVQSFAGARATFTLTPELSSELNRLCRQEGVTLFMLLLAAFQTLLYRYSGQTDILVGTPIAGRERKETQDLIGFFVNTLVMRTAISHGLPFKELLRRTRETALDAYAHQDVPFEKIVEELRLERDTSREALFQVMFIVQNAPVSVLELKGLSLDLLPLHNQTAKFDLVLSMLEHGGRLTGTLEYSTDLFDTTTIERMVGHFETLLQSVATDPAQRLDDLPLLATEEEHHLLFELNDTSEPYPFAALVHQQFEIQAARTPEALALVFEDQELSYRELNQRANRLAHILQDAGVSPEVLVGIMMERSVEMVVAVLGVMKAGGCYVPLDPEYPQQRIAYMLHDSKLRWLLTQQRLLELVPLDNVETICIDAEPRLKESSVENPAVAVCDQHAAYMIYTSGSTGNPKGTQIPHGALVNFLHSMRRAPGLTQDDVLLAVTTLSFDIAALELYLPLTTGARLVLTSRDVAADGRRLLERLENVTAMQATPATWRMMLEAGWQKPLPLKVLCGGEALPRDLAVQLLDRSASLWNMYGPTETTIWSAVHHVEHRDGPIPIGRPIANTEMYVLDRAMRPVPVGVAGELYIGGDGLARGYFGRPELTAEKFVPHPSSLKSGARLYKTGDLARYLPNGEIEFLGRIDHQVKIRGFRIELGEIEAVLRQVGGVQDVVVAAREDHAGENSLVAYLVKEPAASLEIDGLRSRIKEKLPVYMTPAHFVFLNELPLTSNGKVDRRALPAPMITATESSSVALNQMEEILAQIWADVLGLERIGRDDNFFDLGGHSLLATKLIHRIQETLGVTLPLRTVFEEPTVAAAARTIEHLMQTGNAPVLPPIQRVERSRELPLSFAQQRLWILAQFDPNTYNGHSAIRLTGNLDVAALEKSFNEIINRHEILRTTFRAVDGRSIQIISPSRPLPLPVLDLRHLSRSEADAQVSRLVVAECGRPFNLAEGPLLRVLLFRTGEHEHVAVLSLPHIVFDAWSNAILIQEVATLYEAFSQGKSSPLPELPIQYADFAVWQRELLQPAVLETHLAYWKQQLDGAPRSLQLPVDRAETSPIQGASVPFQFPAALADDLKVLSRQHGVTLFMTLLAAFKILLYSYSRQTDIVVGTNVANRPRGELEKLIGFFINLLVLRTDLSGGPSLRTLLSRVREVTLKALAHQDLPFEKLITELKLDRDRGQTPLVRAVVQLQTPPGVPLELPGLAHEFLDTGIKSVPFDLVLNVGETNDGLAGDWLYHAGLFDRTTIARMSSRFGLLLNQLVAAPDMTIDEIVAAITDAESRQRQALREEFKTTRRMKLRNVQLQPVLTSDS